MTYVRVKGFKIFQDKKPPFRWRCYHRATRTAIEVDRFPIGSAEFIAECARISALASKADLAKPGTLGLLIEKYRAHSAFLDLAPRTRADYQRIFDYLKKIADTPLARFTPPLVVGIRDKAGEKHGRRFGTYTKTVLSLLFAWGLERGFIASNPAFKIKGLKRPKDAPQANRPWRDAERHAVEEALPAHMRLPVALMMYCGLDPQDALTLPHSAIRDGMIDTKRGKTKEPVWLPLPTPVSEALSAAPIVSRQVVCANSKGHPWTMGGFATSWRKVRLALEESGAIEPGLTMKGLRHTVATILAEAGHDERTIADMLGQKTIEMARHYSRRADRTRKNTATLESFEKEVERRRSLSKPSGKSVKPPIQREAESDKTP